MKNVLIILSCLSFLFSNIEVNSQTIKITFHKGYTCRPTIKGEEVRAACMTTETMEYQLKNKKYKAKKLKRVKEIIPLPFKEKSINLETDSLNIITINKSINRKSFLELMTLLELAIKQSKNNHQMKLGFKKTPLQIWDKHTFELSELDFIRLQKVAKKMGLDTNRDSIVQTISTYIEKENQGLLVSSVAAWIKIKILHKGQEYTLSQSTIGKLNTNWHIQTGNNDFYFISPTMNKIISALLPKQMPAKKQLLEFMSICELKKIFDPTNEWGEERFCH